jgi:hypothetical protein
MSRRVCASIVTALALSGCALTPDEVMQKGSRQTASSRLAPRDVAACIGRNAESVTRSGETLGYPTGRRGYEVLLHYPDAGIAAVFSIKPAGTGSDVTAWVTPYIASPEVAFGNLMWGC